MSTIKLSTGEFPRQEYSYEEVMTEALAAFRGIVQAHGGEGSPFDTGLASEACYALAAMMIETLPAVATNRDMRTMAEDAGGRILAYTKVFRETYEKHGRHALEALGASSIPPAATIN